MFFKGVLKKIKCKSKSREGSFQKTYTVHSYLEIIETDKKDTLPYLQVPQNMCLGRSSGKFRFGGIKWAILSLTNFQPMFLFYTPWKHQKTSGFLMFSRGYRSGTLVKNELISENTLHGTQQMNFIGNIYSLAKFL